MRQAPKPLVVRIRNWVGDVILGLPGLQLIESQGYELHLVARGKWAPSLLAGHGWPVHVQPASLRDKVAQLRHLRQDLARRDPGFTERENAFLLPVSFSAALELRLAGLKPVGVAKEGRSLLLARAEPWAETGHELERYWDIACRFAHQSKPAPRDIDFKVARGKPEEAERLLAAQGVTGGFVMICPFAGGKAATADKADKKWPGFQDFTARGQAELGLPLVVYPGPGEHEAARQLYPAARLLGGADLATYAALLQRASLVVANDTGPGHMAAALGRPLISLIGPTDPARWAPWGPNVHVLRHERQGELTVWPTADEAFALSRQLLTT
jgi:ADP-heptose:LPS heptosyltransferase